MNNSNLSKIILETPIDTKLTNTFKISSNDHIKNETKKLLHKMEEQNFINSMNKKKNDLEKIKESFNEFINISEHGATSNNPVNLNKEALKELENKKFANAQRLLEKSKSLDDPLNFVAYYLNAVSIIEENGKPSVDKKNAAINDFKKASYIIEKKLIYQCNMVLANFKLNSDINLPNNENCGLAKQIKARIKVLEAIDKNINENIKEIENYKDGYKLEIDYKKDLKGMFNDNDDEKDEATVIVNSGLKELTKIKNVKDEVINWSAICMIIVGVVQVAAGAIICYCSAGTLSALGVKLCISGVSDIAKGVHSLITDEPINWLEWGFEKVVGVVSSNIIYGVATAIKIVMTYGKLIFGGATKVELNNANNDKQNQEFQQIEDEVDKRNSEFEEESKKQIKKRLECVTQEMKTFVEDAKIKTLVKNQKSLSENVNKIINYIKEFLQSKSLNSDKIINCINQMIIFDKIENKGCIRKLESSISQSVSSNTEIDSQAENITCKLRKIILDSRIQDKVAMYCEKGELKTLFNEFNLHGDLSDFINCVSKSIEDITELNNSNIPHLKIKIKQECKLNDNEVNQIMNLLIQENVTTQKYSYVFQNLSILEEIVKQDDNSEYKFSPKDKENIKKAKNLLMNIGKISKQTIKDNLEHEDRKKMKDIFINKFIDKISYNLKKISAAEDSKFKENFNNAYINTNKSIDDKFAKLNQKDGEYTDITDCIFGDENEQEKIEYSNTSKLLREDMEKNPNGDLLHLVLLSHALSSPIQVIKDDKIHENIGSKFKGNPIIVIYDSTSQNKCKWIDNNFNPTKSIFDLVAKTLNKNTNDIIEICAKELLHNKQITSILRPAYKKYEKEGNLNFKENDRQSTIDLGNSNTFEYKKNKLIDSISNMPLESKMKKNMNSCLSTIKTEKKLDRSIYTIENLQICIDKNKEKSEKSDKDSVLELSKVKSMIKEIQKNCDKSKLNEDLISNILKNCK